MFEGLKDAAIAEETYRSGPSQTYTTKMSDLRAEGFRNRYWQTFYRVASASDTGYCIVGTHLRLGRTFHYSSTQGVPDVGGC